MNKEQLISLNKYLIDLTHRLQGDIPKKHKNRVVSYHRFLRNEISSVKQKLDDAKLEGVK